MVVADYWCFDIEELLNQLGTIILRSLQENDMANPDVLIKQLAAQPRVLLFCVFVFVWTILPSCALKLDTSMLFTTFFV